MESETREFHLLAEQKPTNQQTNKPAKTSTSKHLAILHHVDKNKARVWL